MKTLILITMVFLHIMDDFYLQGILAQMKQKKWWEKQTTDEQYKHDYIAALIIHGFSWSFMVHLPFAGLIVLLDMFEEVSVLVLSLIAHAALHAFIDHFKANKHAINLIEDQLFHTTQVWTIFATTVIAIYG